MKIERLPALLLTLLACVGALAIVFVYTRAAEPAVQMGPQKLVGRWVEVQPNSRKVHNTIDFTADGRYAQEYGQGKDKQIIEGLYTEGPDYLLLTETKTSFADGSPGRTDEVPRFNLKWLDKNRIVLSDGDKISVRFTRE